MYSSQVYLVWYPHEGHLLRLNNTGNSCTPSHTNIIQHSINIPKEAPKEFPYELRGAKRTISEAKSILQIMAQIMFLPPITAQDSQQNCRQLCGAFMLCHFQLILTHNNQSIGSTNVTVES